MSLKPESFNRNLLQKAPPQQNSVNEVVAGCLRLFLDERIKEKTGRNPRMNYRKKTTEIILKARTNLVKKLAQEELYRKRKWFWRAYENIDISDYVRRRGMMCGRLQNAWTQTNGDQSKKNKPFRISVEVSLYQVLESQLGMLKLDWQKAKNCRAGNWAPWDEDGYLRREKTSAHCRWLGLRQKCNDIGWRSRTRPY